ncbi:hypothetical protein ACFQO9_11350 [Chryseobacterium zhengzhouense]|uniref:Uncharacterized protein n=1 Tax=Chryseobacterium zhengzhouense TaxID=1636086 RepID=A0ABW2LYA2_9FLAO
MEDKIKEYLLAKLPFINVGFTGIFLDNITGKLISYHGEEIGISDKNGSFFYLRENGDEDYRLNNSNAPKTIDTAQNYKLVLYGANNDSFAVKNCVLNALWNYKLKTTFPITVVSSSTNLGKIIYSEYPKLKEAERLDILKKLEFGCLLSFDLKITGRITVNDCECKICTTC